MPIEANAPAIMLRTARPSLLTAALCAALALAAQGLRAQSEEQQVEKLRFNRDIRPILSDRCFKCHGFDQQARKAGLRLDTWEGLTGTIDGRQPVVPGEPDRSELVRRIESDDPEASMPKPGSGLTLSAEENALLRRWIEEGADFAPHWAFVPPVKPPLPEVRDSAWPRNEIDRFVLARLETQGLAPAPEADRETLVRRLHLDLIGLPPAPERIDAFVADPAPGAYDELVDELLRSPHFGERMALMWLDAARYADTNGFHHDNVRTAWPYRDWVIRAFQDDMPYDEFVVEQLAGDLLPDATEQQRIATAFSRMHNINDEGGAIDEEYRVEAVADRIETISTTMMGLTFTCCRCHDHKYDPFTQDDYYSLYAYFDSVEERGVFKADFSAARAYPARLEYAPDDLKARIAGAEARLARVRVELEAVEPQVAAELAAWETGLRRERGIAWVDAELIGAEAESGTALERLDDGSVRASAAAKPAEQDAWTLTLRTEATGIGLVRIEALADPSFPGGRVGLAGNGNAVVTAIRAEARSVRDPSRRAPVDFAWGWADHEQPNGDFDLLNAIFARGEGWALEGHDIPGSRTALLVASEPFGFDGGTDLRVTIECRSGYGRHLVGRPRVSLARAGGDLSRDVPLVTSDWWMAGPFGAKSFDEAWEKAHGPATAARIDRDQRFGKVGWKHRPDVRDGEATALSGEHSAWYFAKELRTPNACQVPISLGSDDAIRVFLDGGEVLANKTLRGVAKDQEQLVLELSPGEHVLVVEVVNNQGPAGFYGRVDRAEGAPEPLTPLAWVPPESRDAATETVLVSAFGRRSPTFARLDGEREELEARLRELLAELVPVLVMKELPEPAPTFVLKRGRYDMVDESRPVTRRPPQALGQGLPAGAPNDRLSFARWLVRPDHPLFARVHVNRIWQLLFGAGIVASAENFGQQADWPSHPDLLDWLAVRFADSGFDQKELIRLIVESATYRQSAVIDPDARAADPQNRLLAYFPRRRLSGELVRDLALEVAGLLVPTIGGPSVKPYQPDGLWREVSIGGSSNTQVFRRDDGDALYRRSLYTFWKRTSPNPQMSTFDVPTRESCVVRRGVTNTPLQVLILWNDVQFLEAARVLAQRVLREAQGDGARIERMFRLCTGRHPAGRERDILQRTLDASRERYRQAPDDARALLAQGEAPRLESAGDTADDIDAADAELAAFMMLGSTILSLDETIVRD